MSRAMGKMCVIALFILAQVVSGRTLHHDVDEVLNEARSLEDAPEHAEYSKAEWRAAGIVAGVQHELERAHAAHEAGKAEYGCMGPDTFMYCISMVFDRVGMQEPPEYGSQIMEMFGFEGFLRCFIRLQESKKHWLRKFAAWVKTGSQVKILADPDSSDSDVFKTAGDLVRKAIHCCCKCVDSNNPFEAEGKCTARTDLDTLKTIAKESSAAVADSGITLKAVIALMTFFGDVPPELQAVLERAKSELA